MKRLLQKHKYIYLEISFIVAFLPRMLLCLQEYPVRMISDEIATMSGAAYFAGLDWSAVISKAGYYGSGFYGLFFWLFKLTDNPFIIYKVILIGAAFAQSLVAVIAFIIMERYFNIKDKKVICIFSIASSYMVVTFPNRAYNEHILILITWIVTLILLEIKRNIGEKTKVRILTSILIIILSYSLTIHTRALTIWIACAFVILLYYFVNRKWLISKSIAILGSILGYFLSHQFVLLVQKAIWAAESGATVRNGAINVSIGFKLTDPYSLFSLVSVIAGQLNTISVFTGGFIIICFTFLTWLFFRILKAKIICKNEVISKDQNNYFIIAVFLLASVGMTIIAQTITWLPGVIEGFKEGIGTKAYFMKAITYIRYFGPYLGPGVMVGFICGYKNRNCFIKVLKPAIVIFAILQIFWIFAITPFIKNNTYTKEVFTALSLSKPGDKVSLITYMPGIALTIVVFLLIIILYYKKKTVLPVIIVCCMCLFQYIYSSIYFDQNASKKNMMKANSGYALIHKMENFYEIPTELYVYDASDKTDHQIYYMYQFLLNRYKIIPELPKDDLENAIIFTNSPSVKELFVLGYKCIQLDKNEFVYVKGSRVDEVCEIWS